MALKESVSIDELAKLIAHFSYKNEDFTKKIIKILLHGISRNDYEKVKGYLEVVTQLALI